MTEIANAAKGIVESMTICWFGVQTVKILTSTFLIYMGKASFDDVLKWFSLHKRKGMF